MYKLNLALLRVSFRGMSESREEQEHFKSVPRGFRGGSGGFCTLLNGFRGISIWLCWFPGRFIGIMEVSGAFRDILCQSRIKGFQEHIQIKGHFRGVSKDTVIGSRKIICNFLKCLRSPLKTHLNPSITYLQCLRNPSKILWNYLQCFVALKRLNFTHT